MPKICRQVEVANSVIGGNNFTLIAGPCSIESEEQMLTCANAVQQMGVGILRGGIFKLRTSPNSFQGMGNEAFEFINRVKNEISIPLVSEITDPRQIGDLDPIVDMFQVGSRNMYNYSLLKELGQLRKPVLLKRGFSATIKEWLLAAEYVEMGGNQNIVLCERGIRSFEPETRNTLDLNAVAWVKAHADFPVLVDPSHGTGRSELVHPMSLAAAAAGADGLLIEVHPDPQKAKSDGYQALDFEAFGQLIEQLQPMLKSLGRGMNGGN